MDPQVVLIPVFFSFGPTRRYLRPDSRGTGGDAPHVTASGELGGLGALELGVVNLQGGSNGCPLVVGWGFQPGDPDFEGAGILYSGFKPPLM